MEENGITRMVVIGGSAGSLDVIIRIIAAIPENTKNIFIIIVHRKSSADSILSDLLATKTALPVKEVEDKDPMLPGYVYVAPSDYHLLLEDKTTFSLDASEKLHYSRPSIDVTFESVAEIFGEHATGILLSGANADGADGLCSIKAAGGYTIAQDPETAEVGFMPRQAIEMKCVELIASPSDIAAFIANQ